MMKFASLVPKDGLDIEPKLPVAPPLGKMNHVDKYNGMECPDTKEKNDERGKWVYKDRQNLAKAFNDGTKVADPVLKVTAHREQWEPSNDENDCGPAELHAKFLKYDAERIKRNAAIKITPTVNHLLPTWKKFLGLFNYNTILYWIVMAPCMAVGYQYGSFWVFFGTWAAVFCFIEYLSYFRGFNYFDMDGIMCGTYALWSYTMEANRFPGYDYGPLLFHGDTTKSAVEAIKDKYDHAFEEMGLEEGMNVLDVGCGLGHWLTYLKVAKKCNVVGINIAKTQVAECRARGLDVVEMNWKDIENDKTMSDKLFGKFDVVTYWDCVEHFVLSRDSRNLQKVDATYRSVFDFARKCIKPTSKLRRVWISAMHDKKPDGFYREKLSSVATFVYWCFSELMWVKKVTSLYFNDRTLSGSYPNIERDTLNMCANKENFKKIFTEDITHDAMITLCSTSTHPVNRTCGNSWEKWFLFSCLIITCPYWFHQQIFYCLDSWRFQFDPNAFAFNVGDATWMMWEDNTPRDKKGKK